MSHGVEYRRKISIFFFLLGYVVLAASVVVDVACSTPCRVMLTDQRDRFRTSATLVVSFDEKLRAFSDTLS